MTKYHKIVSFDSIWLKGWEFRNQNFVINYSPSCQPVRPLFIFRTQVKIFLMKSKSFLTLHRRQHLWQVQVQKKGSKDIVKIVLVTSVVQPQCYEATRILFVHKENDFNAIFNRWCDFKFSFLFGVLQAECAYIRSLKLQRLKSQNQRYILYQS